MPMNDRTSSYNRSRQSSSSSSYSSPSVVTLKSGTNTNKNVTFQMVAIVVLMFVTIRVLYEDKLLRQRMMQYQNNNNDERRNSSSKEHDGDIKKSAVVSPSFTSTTTTMTTSNKTTTTTTTTYFDFSTIVQNEQLARSWVKKREEILLITTSSSPSVSTTTGSSTTNRNTTITNSSWCVTTSSNNAFGRGFLLNKLPKAASSTMGSVVLTIAHNVAKRRRSRSHHFLSSEKPMLNEDEDKDVVCKYNVEHIAAMPKRYRTFGKRNRQHSILVSTVRHPTKRSISRVFFSSVSIGGQNATDDNVILKGLHRTHRQFGTIEPKTSGFQLWYLSFDNIYQRPTFWTNRKPNDVQNTKEIHELVKKVLWDKQWGYDFLVVVERFDESLVAMKMLFDLELNDILYLSSKNTHGETIYHYVKEKCVPLTPSFQSNAVTQYVNSQEWYAKNYGDFLLHEATNQSLDLTIDDLGRDKFQSTLKEFQRLLKVAKQQCSDDIILPCGTDGQLQLEASAISCYESDMGCAHECLSMVK